MNITTDALAAAYALGREKAEQTAAYNYDILIPESFKGVQANFPPLAETDLVAEVMRLDRERLANPPDPYKYPETKGLPDLLVEERRGFLDECGGDELLLAYTYTWTFYYTRRINTRYLPGVPGKIGEGCTAVFIPNSTEGGPLYGRNWDNPLNAWTKSLMEPPREAADGARKMWTKGVSCSVFLDEEPEEIFPVDPWELLPAECTGRVDDAVAFLDRYRDFWGPCNCILVDTNLDSAALEKANCRLGVRKMDGGASAVTALSYQVPEMKAFKDERDRKSVELRGWTIEEAPDWYYWRGADKRYQRLLQLTAEANRKGADLWDMAAITTDHAVPYPDRVCIAGEFRHPLVPRGGEEWTAVSHCEVLEGPNRRMLFFVVEDDKACYDNPPYLVPGKGVAVKPEWTPGTRPLPPVPHKPRPLHHADHPHLRVMM
jgi:hypothetical protein